MRRGQGRIELVGDVNHLRTPTREGSIFRKYVKISKQDATDVATYTSVIFP